MIIVFGGVYLAGIWRAGRADNDARGQSRLRIVVANLACNFARTSIAVEPTWISPAAGHPIVGADAIEVAHGARGIDFLDAMVAVVSDHEHPGSCVGQAVGLIELGEILSPKLVTSPFKAGVGGYDTGGRIDEQNAVAAGIANRKRAVILHGDAA